MIPLPDLSLKSCKTVEEQDRRRHEYERQKEEKRIRYEAAKLRMKIARRRRAQERARRRKMRKTQHELIMIKARDTMLQCQRTARVCIEVEVIKIYNLDIIHDASIVEIMIF
ncbi:unnamed protein product [Caenorhabditis nigoni]